MESYKRLDKLCKDCYDSDSGITFYLQTMKSLRPSIRCASSWNEDYRKLNHYRYIRNQIAHNPECSEETMCCPGDAEWLDGFYQRIIDGSDPLTLHRKASEKSRKEETPVLRRADSTFLSAHPASPEKPTSPKVAGPVKKDSPPPKQRHSSQAPEHYRFTFLDGFVLLFALAAIGLFLFAILVK